MTIDDLSAVPNVDAQVHGSSDRAATDAIRFAAGTCSLGSILVAASDRGVCALLLGDGVPRLVRELRGRFPDARPADGDALAPVLAAAIAVVEDPTRGFDAPLDLRGTPFQMRVWQALRDIPAGSTASYGEIAGLVGAPATAIEVGLACASNTIAVAIPCHRVVRKDGGLAGYRWGVARKRALLEREASAGAWPCRQLHEASAAASRPRQLPLLPAERAISA